MKPPPPKLVWLDATRTISILAVILIHASSKTLQSFSNSLPAHEFTFFTNQITRFAVPVFFMVSGFALALSSRHLSYWQFLRRRFTKILLPFITWSLIYYWFVYPSHSHPFLQTIFWGESSYQLYFVPSLLLLYLIFPPLYRLFSRASIGTIGLLAAAQIGVLGFDYYIQVSNSYFPPLIALFNFFPFIYGIWSVNRHPSSKLNLPMAALIGIMVVVEGWYFFVSTGRYELFYSQWRPSVLVYSLLIFELAKLWLNSSRTFISRLAGLSQYSYSVFLNHVLVLEFVWPSLSQFHSLPGFNLILFSIVSLFSFLLAYILNLCSRKLLSPLRLPSLF